LPCPDSSSSFQARAPSHLGVCIIVQAVVMPSMTTFQQWLLLPACSSMPCYVEIFSYKSWSRSFPFQRHWSSHQRTPPHLLPEARPLSLLCNPARGTVLTRLVPGAPLPKIRGLGFGLRHAKILAHVVTRSGSTPFHLNPRPHSI